MKTREIKWFLVVFAILCGIGTVSAQKVYNMETMCNSAGVYDIDPSIYVILRAGYVPNGFLGQTCSVKFRATNGDHILSFSEPTNQLACNGAVVEIVYSSNPRRYVCDTLSPGKFSTMTRQAEVRLSVTNSMASYGKFEIQISAGITPLDPALNSSSSVSVGLIVGAVVGVCVFLFLICIIGVCMHRKISRAKANEAMYNASRAKEPLEMDSTPNRSVGFTNNYMNNREESPLAKTKLLRSYEENGKESPNSSKRMNRPDTLDVKNSYRTPVAPQTLTVMTVQTDRSVDPNYQDDGEDTYYNMDEDKIEQPNRPQTPVTPILSALQSNPKFRKSFTENERDAEDRAKRISYSTSNDSLHQRPALPKIPIETKKDTNSSRTAKINKNMSMRRATRPDSYVDHSSSNGSDEAEDERRNVEDQQRNLDNGGKPKHTLRPNRKPSPEADRKKLSKPKDSRLNDLRDDDDNESRIGLFQKGSSIRSSKGSRKSPRLGKNTKGFGHRRTGSRGDDAISIGSRTDLESLPPLQRSSSKNSLYASRSSLYSRRKGSGRGERLDSYAGSVRSYAHDDIDYYRRPHRSEYDYDDDDDFGGYEKPISRNDRLRLSKSDHDLGRAMKESATQTLRETATQTGQTESVVVHTKMVVKKRPRSRSMSAMGTQTKKDKQRTKSKQDLASTDDEQLEPRKPEIKPKPKPKPKPRKSLSNADNGAQSDTDTLKKKRLKKRSKSEANRAKSMEDVAKEEDVAEPGPQVPHHMHHSQTVPTNLRTYGPQGMPVPPPYTTLPHGIQPTQYVDSQGQPVFLQGQGQPMMIQNQGQPIMNGQQIQNPNIPQNNVIPGQQANPRQPRKSNWDMLVEMTEKQKMGIPTDTESIVSSVFTSNPPPTYLPGQAGYYPYQQGYGQQQPIPNYQPQQVQPMVVQQPPSVHLMQQPSAAEQYPPSQGWAPSTVNQNGAASSSSQTSGSGSGSSTSGMYRVQSNSQSLPSQGKSSWDKLKEITDQQYKVAYVSENTETKNESVV